MHLRLLLGRASVALALLALLPTLGFRCPGPEPEASLEGVGGGGGSSTGAVPQGTGGGDSSTQSSGKSTSASHGTGGSGAEGGAGGQGAGEGAGGQGGTGGAGGGGGEDCGDTQTAVLNCGRCGRVCETTNVLDGEARCEEGVCTSKCEDGWENLETPEVSPIGMGDDDDGCETAWRRVFVTSGAVAVPILEMGAVGAAAADLICQSYADDAALGGEWKAWLSDGELPPPAGRFETYDFPYWRLDGVKIADTWDDVVDGDLDAPIVVTEMGRALPVSPNPDQALLHVVWTATGTSGLAGANHCTGWTSNDVDDGNRAHVGLAADLVEANLPASAWTAAEDTQACNHQQARLYCFEQ